jgi:hypothetical protein
MLKARPLAITTRLTSAPVARRPRTTRFRLLTRLCRMGLATHMVSVMGFK